MERPTALKFKELSQYVKPTRVGMLLLRLGIARRWFRSFDAHDFKSSVVNLRLISLCVRVCSLLSSIDGRTGPLNRTGNSFLF